MASASMIAGLAKDVCMASSKEHAKTAEVKIYVCTSKSNITAGTAVGPAIATTVREKVPV